MGKANKIHKATPMMEQYLAIRKRLPSNTLLFFRLGDFYELFMEDAQEASRILGITLTKRHDLPMAGIPFHAAEPYINKLLRAGKKVGICDQVESPQPGKLVKRELTRILTPGTTLEASQLNENENHYLLAISFHKQTLCAAWIDVTIGGFAIAVDPKPKNLLPIFAAINPKEIIFSESFINELKLFAKEEEFYLEFHSFIKSKPFSELPAYHFDATLGAKFVMESLGVLSLEGFGISQAHPALGTASALLSYIKENFCRCPSHIRSLKEYFASKNLLLDPATLKSLEIFKSSEGSKIGTLLEAMDNTVTAAGARLLESYLASPLLDLEEIKRRQACVRSFLLTPSKIQELQQLLRKVRDIKRILTRLQNTIRNPREVGAIRDTLNMLPLIKEALEAIPGQAIQDLSHEIDLFEELRKLLNDALNDELPVKLQEGNIIRHGYDNELDGYLGLSKNTKKWLTQFEQAEQKKTGIKNLKVKFNNNFGYFIEVTNTNLHLVPPSYIRKQTMTNAERFYTKELKQKEVEILTAEEKAIFRQEILFKEILGRILEQVTFLEKAAEALAQVDLFLGWAKIAKEWNYTCPQVNESNHIKIEQGRHPVVEQSLHKRGQMIHSSVSHSFVPNDTWLKSDDEQIAMITGPNMAGKSTYIRQVALITLMAQVGSFVPADDCHIGLVDRIFSRVGANDEISKGNSTFMVEMNETANILNNATKNSLIILDEIGRGTSTYDGLSIAWAVVEYLHSFEGANEGPKTLFATHYHELTQLEQGFSRIKNYCVAVKEWKEQIIFVRQVIPGSADRSYGIQVARLAGLPLNVIQRAKVILGELESGNNKCLVSPSVSKEKKHKKSECEAQLSFGL